MLYIVINVIFNSLFLAIILKIFINTYSFIQLYLFAYIMVSSITLTGFTWLRNLFFLLIPQRKAVKQELYRILPILKSILTKVNSNYNKNYKTTDFKIYINNNKTINGSAFGYNTIIINRGSLNNLNDGQLTALIAHEVAHLFYRDSIRLIILSFSSCVTQCIMYLYRVISKIFIKTHSLLFLLIYIPFLPFRFLNYVATKLFYYVNMSLIRSSEYRADNFAVTIGYTQEKISLLEMLDEIYFAENSFIDKLHNTHPDPMERIKRIEQNKQTPVQFIPLWIDVLKLFSMLFIFIVSVIYLRLNYKIAIPQSKKLHKEFRQKIGLKQKMHKITKQKQLGAQHKKYEILRLVYGPVFNKTTQCDEFGKCKMEVQKGIIGYIVRDRNNNQYFKKSI